MHHKKMFCPIVNSCWATARQAERTSGSAQSRSGASERHDEDAGLRGRSRERAIVEAAELTIPPLFLAILYAMSSNPPIFDCCTPCPASGSVWPTSEPIHSPLGAWFAACESRSLASAFLRRHRARHEQQRERSATGEVHLWPGDFDGARRLLLWAKNQCPKTIEEPDECPLLISRDFDIVNPPHLIGAEWLEGKARCGLRGADSRGEKTFLRESRR